MEMVNKHIFGFDTLKKYKSLGRIGGTVKLANLKPEEKEVLSNHFRKDYSRQRSANIRVATFEETLKETKFYPYTLAEILEAFYDEPLTGKREDQEALKLQRDEFFQRLLIRFPSGMARLWLEASYDGRSVGVRTVDQWFVQEGEREGLFQHMSRVCDALNSLPEDRGPRERLPVFASRITYNPHGFDLGIFGDNLLFNALCTVYDIKSPQGSIERAEVYYRAGILVDEISNFVTVSGLLAHRGIDPDPVWAAARASEQILQVPLINLSRIDRVESSIKKVFVVENPGVFGTIVDRGLFPPMVCTFGQPKLSGLVLLDLLAENDTEIFYSGDFDPEGLQIADSLWKRYGEKLKLWRYDPEDYQKALSQKTISPRRLSILDNINCLHLQEVAAAIRATKRAGYQELLIDDLIESLQNIVDLLEKSAIKL